MKITVFEQQEQEFLSSERRSSHKSYHSGELCSHAGSFMAKCPNINGNRKLLCDDNRVSSCDRDCDVSILRICEWFP